MHIANASASCKEEWGYIEPIVHKIISKRSKGNAQPDLFHIRCEKNKISFATEIRLKREMMHFFALNPPFLF